MTWLFQVNEQLIFTYISLQKMTLKPFKPLGWSASFCLKMLLQPLAEILETLYLGLTGLPVILCLLSPLLPLSKLLAIQDHAQNLEEQLLMEGRREVNDLK